MADISINYLFPPDRIEELPTWRFVLNFEVPPGLPPTALQAAVDRLKGADWKIVTFPFGLDNLSLDASGQAVGVSVEVPEDSRRRPDSLADYESDVWKIIGNMAECGFGALYYQAVDWQD